MAGNLPLFPQPDVLSAVAVSTNGGAAKEVHDIISVVQKLLSKRGDQCSGDK